AGPDPSEPATSPLQGCDSYGHGSPLADPAAKMEVTGSALGGSQRRAVITITVSSTGPIGGYSGTIVDEHGALETSPASQNVRPTIVDHFGIFSISSGGFQSCRIIDGRMTFGLIWSLTEGRELPGGQHVPVADFIACIKPGTTAGEYPLTLQSGEMIASCTDGNSRV